MKSVDPKHVERVAAIAWKYVEARRAKPRPFPGIGRVSYRKGGNAPWARTSYAGPMDVWLNRSYSMHAHAVSWAQALLPDGARLTRLEQEVIEVEVGGPRLAMFPKPPTLAAMKKARKAKRAKPPPHTVEVIAKLQTQEVDLVVMLKEVEKKVRFYKKKLRSVRAAIRAHELILKRRGPDDTSKLSDDVLAKVLARKRGAK